MFGCFAQNCAEAIFAVIITKDFLKLFQSRCKSFTISLATYCFRCDFFGSALAEIMADDFPRDFFKAARVALRLSNLRMAKLAHVSPATLSAVEDPERIVLSRTILQVQEALEELGVEFHQNETRVGFMIRKHGRQED